MQFEIIDQSSVRKQVNIEVPAKRVDSTFAAVYNQLSQKASLPGFRKGKVLMSHVRKFTDNRPSLPSQRSSWMLDGVSC